MKLKILLFAALCFLSATVIAQTKDSLKTELPQISLSPVPVEVFAGNNGVSFQLIVSKYFKPDSRLGFFNVTQFTGKYDTADQAKNELMSLALISFDIWKGFSLNTGAFIDNYGGFSPTAGIQYLFANKDFLIIALPRFDLARNYNFEAFGLAEYRPMFTKNWGFYIRGQAMYNRNIKQDFLERSYVNLRTGVTYQNFQFGLGYNYDVYGGTFNSNQHSFGVFLRAELF
ncbi:hypothetical protein [Kaistella sp.]|uniref:hypothetical protein n=1 Tax=Kaistella sp. TaxID=2782235 RepID=UPI003C5A2A1A